MKILTVTGLLVLASVHPPYLLAQEATDQTVQVGLQKQLFIDGYVIAATSGIEKLTGHNGSRRIRLWLPIGLGKGTESSVRRCSTTIKSAPWPPLSGERRAVENEGGE